MPKDCKSDFTNYPKTSCLCGTCPDIKYSTSRNPPCKTKVPGFVDLTLKDKLPNNLSMNGCNDPRNPCSPSFPYNCFDKGLYNRSEQPALCPKDKLTNINTVGTRYSCGFTEVICPTGSNSACEDAPTYMAQDSRLFDLARAQWLKLDRPPLDGEAAVGNVKKDEIYSTLFGNYGKKYCNYNSINAGQIQYYIDSSIEDAYFNPIFTERANVEHVIFVDPMESVKPQYNRTPIFQYSISDHRGEGDSYTADSLWFREDIMSRQMRKMNQQKYSARYSEFS